MSAAVAPAAQSDSSNRRQRSWFSIGRGGAVRLDRGVTFAMAASAGGFAMVSNNVAAGAKLLTEGISKAGSQSEKNGSASTATEAAVQTRWRNAADWRRSNNVVSQAMASTTVLFTAISVHSANQVVSFNIYLPSRFAFSIISAMRSSSSRVNSVEETSRSAATICSGEPL